MIECESCGTGLNINTGAVDHGVDWVKVVCPDCNRVNQVSIIQEVARID